MINDPNRLTNDPNYLTNDTNPMTNDPNRTNNNSIDLSALLAGGCGGGVALDLSADSVAVRRIGSTLRERMFLCSVAAAAASVGVWDPPEDSDRDV